MFAFPSRGAWLVCAGLIVLNGVWMAAAGYSIALRDLLPILGAAGITAGVGAFYTVWRPRPALASMCLSVVYLVVFTAAVAVFSYLCAGLAPPLLDARFVAMDAALGFDWTAHVQWVADRPWLASTLYLAYFSCQAQLLVALVGLSILDRAKLTEFMTLYAATVLVVIVASALWPAVGAYHHFAPVGLGSIFSDPELGRWHYAHLFAVRAGEMREIALGDAKGLVQFPSFHTALAIITARALAAIPRLALPAMALNGLVILSTLSIGGHYLVDVIAGAALAGAAILAVEHRARRRAGVNTPALPDPAGAALR